MDKILRALICGGQVSLAVLQTTRLVNRAAEIHNLYQGAVKLLGGLLTCGAYLASSLKEVSGAVSLTVKAKDGDGAASVSVDKQLRVRGYVDGACNSSLKGGALTVVREDGFSQPFVGACEADSDEVSDLLEIYFGQSEQIPTAAAFKSSFDSSGKCLYYGGAVMQLLPDASDSAICKAAELLESYKRGAEEIEEAEVIFEKYFAESVYGEAATLFPEYKCNCSENKIKGILSAVGREELLKICEEQGEVRVHCHYCNTDYIYDRKRIEETF